MKWLALVLAAAMATVSFAQIRAAEVISTGILGLGNDGHPTSVTMSTDGRYVALATYANNFSPLPVSGRRRIVLIDRITETSTQVDVNSRSEPASSESSNPMIAREGKSVAFESLASNLTNANRSRYARNVFVRDLDTKLTECISIAPEPIKSNNARLFDISSNGRFVLFATASESYLSFNPNYNRLFLRDRTKKTTTEVGVSSKGTIPKSTFEYAQVSDDGKTVVFASADRAFITTSYEGSNLFVKTLSTGAVKKIGIAPNGNHEYYAAAFGASADTNLIGFVVGCYEGNSRVNGVRIYNRALNSYTELAYGPQYVALTGDGSAVIQVVKPDQATVHFRRIPLDGSTESFVGPSFSSGGSYWFAELSGFSGDGRLGVCITGDALSASDMYPGADAYVVFDGDNNVSQLIGSTNGGIANGECVHPVVSDDRNKVVYVSFATNLWTPIPKYRQIYLSNRALNQTELVSQDPIVNGSRGIASKPFISGDGNTVVYYWDAGGLPGSVTGWVLYNCTTKTSRILDRIYGDIVAVSGDGKRILLNTYGALDLSDTNGVMDAYWVDVNTLASTRVSLTSQGAQSATGGKAWTASPDGRFVVLSSETGEIAGKTSELPVIIRKDTATGRVSLIVERSIGLGDCPISITANGRQIAFIAQDGISNATSGIWDESSGKITPFSASRNMAGLFDSVAISYNGRYLQFGSIIRDLKNLDTWETDSFTTPARGNAIAMPRLIVSSTLAINSGIHSYLLHPNIEELTVGDADRAPLCSLNRVGPEITKQRSIEVTASGSDWKTMPKDLKFQFQADGGEWSPLQSAASYRTDELSDGIHQIFARCVDEDGFYSEITSPLFVTIDTAPPTMVFVSASNTNKSVVAVFSGSEILYARVTLTASGYSQTDNFSRPDSNGQLTNFVDARFSSTKVGITYHYVAVPIDRAGNEGPPIEGDYTTV